ncbi:hypothetical protein ACXPWS_07630 [Mycobacterium sp. BMJ-28]
MTIGVGSEVVPLTEDATGYVGHIDIDGQPCVIHVSITPTGARRVSPAKWERPA